MWRRAGQGWEKLQRGTHRGLTATLGREEWGWGFPLGVAPGPAQPAQGPQFPFHCPAGLSREIILSTQIIQEYQPQTQIPIISYLDPTLGFLLRRS